MKISIITVCYNAADTLGDTLDSVASQDYPDIEHIVIDGGSTDGTAEVMKEQGQRVAVWRSEPDRGIYDAMNKGLRLATGDVIGFLNADDVFLNSGVVSRIAAIMSDTSLDACYANLYYVEREKTDVIKRVWRSRDYEPGLCARGWMPAHPTFYVRRSVYGRLGGFDLDYKLQADFDIAMRFLEVHKIRSRFVPEFWVRMRMGGVSNSSVRNVIRGNLEAYRACHKNGVRVPPWFILIKIFSRLSQFLNLKIEDKAFEKSVR